MDQDKTRYDVMVHLTDIPMLGKQYVPGLWRQFEGGPSQQPVIAESMQVGELVAQRNVTPTTSVQQIGKKNNRAQTGGFHRVVDKRVLPQSSDVVADSSLSAPPSKTPRIEKR